MGYGQKLFTLTAQDNFLENQNQRKHTNVIKIYLKYFLFISFDAICKKDIKLKISNWPDPGGQIMDMTQNYLLLLHKGNFPEKIKTAKAHKYAQNIV